jgi:hypothetical protein
MIIAEAVKQKQQCSITFDDITADNASVTTCGHVFTTDAIKQWMQQHDSCPECRKQCRINGAPAPPQQPPQHMPPVFIFGAPHPPEPVFYFAGPNIPGTFGGPPPFGSALPFGSSNPFAANPLPFATGSNPFPFPPSAHAPGSA